MIDTTWRPFIQQNPSHAESNQVQNSNEEVESTSDFDHESSGSTESKISVRAQARWGGIYPT